MNIDINLIPAELRPKPLIDTRTFALIVVVLLLGFGCFYFFNAKGNTQSDISSLESQITRAKQQTTALTSNAEAVQLNKTISQLKTAKQSYDSFIASKVLWGKALQRVYDLVPLGVSITAMKQSASSLTISGTSSEYTYVSDFARALNNDPSFTLKGLPSFKDGSFSLVIDVTPGGGR